MRKQTMATGSTKGKTTGTRAKADTKKPPASVTLTPRKTSAVPASPTAAAKPATIAKPATPVSAKSMMKKAELIDQVVERTGVKKRDAKASVEAALAIMSETLIKETDLNLPPLGKVRLVKSMDQNEGAKVLTLKLRTMKTKTT